MMEKISVIIPTWNRAGSIAKSIHSALHQTLPPMEILVCDDGSTDNTSFSVKSIKNSKVTWIPGPHSGLPAVARNRGIKQAKGEWIAFLDSDDQWLPKKLEKQIDLANKTKCLAACCNAYRIEAGRRPKKYLNYSGETVNFFDLLNVNQVICSSAVIHRSLLSKCLGFSEIPSLKTGQDYAFWLRVATQTPFVYLSEPLVRYLDEPRKSNRRFTKNPLLQKRVILEDFLWWGLKNNISLKYFQRAVFCYLYTVKNLLFSSVSF